MITRTPPHSSMLARHPLQVAVWSAVAVCSAGVVLGLLIKVPLGLLLSHLGAAVIGMAAVVAALLRTQPSTVVTDAAGKPQGFLGVQWDIAPQVETPESVSREAEDQHHVVERLKHATEFAGLSIWDWDLKTGKLAADSRMSEAFGRINHMGMEDAQRFVAETLHPEDRDEFMRVLHGAIAASDRVSHRYRVMLPNDPVLHHVQLHARVFRDDAGVAQRLLAVSWDVTALIEASQKVERQSQHERALRERLNLATRVGGIGVWEWDVVADRMTLDEQAGQAYGSGEVVVERDARAFFTAAVIPEDRDSFNATVDRALASEDTLSHRYRVLLPTGGLHHIQINAHIFRDAGGGALSMLGVSMDVTAETLRAQQLEQQAEEERALRDRFNLATHTAGIGVWNMDLRTRRMDSDANTRRLLGSNGSLDEPTLISLIHDEDRDAVMRSIQEALFDASHDGIVSIRHRLAPPDAPVRHVQTHLRMFRDATGTSERILGVTWDVSAEVQHTMQLQQQAEHVQALLDRISVANKAAGISAWEIDVRTRRFLWAENRLPGFGLTDVPLQEYGNALARVMHPDDLKEVKRVELAAIASGAQTYTNRFRLVRADGTERHIQGVAHISRDEHGTAVRLLGAMTDITNEVQTTALLQRQAEQERALLDRLSMATRAAGIKSWEMDLVNSRLLWFDNFDAYFSSGNTENLLEDLVASQHPDDRKAFEQAAAEAISNHSDLLSYRVRIKDDNGGWRHKQNYARLIMDESGKPVQALGVTWDVTSEVLSAEKLEQQARHERTLLERLNIATQAADISSWELDLVAGHFLWMENPIRAITENRPAANTLNELIERIHPEDRDSVALGISKAIAAGTDRVSTRYRVIAWDGRIVHVQSFSKFFCDAEGRPVRALGVSWDITPEVEAAALLEQQTRQLREAEHRLERASLSSSEGHWEWDFTENLAWYSASCHTLLGYRQGDLPTGLMASLRAMQHPEDIAWQDERFERHIKDGEPYDFECRLRLRGGEHRWFRVRGAAERDANGTAIAMAGSMQDIHQQKLAEDALKLAQRRFERAINGTQDGLWELEADGSAWCSPRVGELLGYAAEEFPSNTNFLRMYLHAEDANAVASATQAHFQQEQPYDVEIRLRTRSGEYRWYRARAIAERDPNGRPVRLSGSLQDVTEARAAHQELVRATEAAEAASRAKSEFLANVSHEIRTPMNGIIGMTGLLLDTTLDRTQRDYAETIRGSADSLLIVINDILDFSKIEAGKLAIDSIELDLRSSVEDVGSMLAFQASAKKLELVVLVHPDLPDRVLGDPQRIRQCLVNLVGNAIKFTRTGEVMLEVRNVGRRDGKVLTQFEVRDTGIGIAPDTLQTLFQPFVQADSSTTRHFGGTGLGLSIVRRLVEMMGGAVGVESEPGKGSTFWFTLPLEPAIAPALTFAPGDLTRLGHRVLIVDDNETNRRVLAGQLMHAGYEVSLAGGGNDALQMLRQGVSDGHPYDIVLADYQMHDMDGATLGERINADVQLSRARIVILTAVDRHSDIRRFASLGFAGYLTKPVRSRDLLECLDRLLSLDAREWHLQSQPIVTSNMLAATEKTRRYQGHVLLVEDNAVNQKVAVRFLERMGCQVRVADNGAEGVKAFQEGKFDIVLMDLQMPIMDGLAATHAIRALKTNGPMTPIVALTANAMSGQLERCMEAGMNGFLTKPLEIARLHETLERFGMAVTHTTAASVVEAAPVDLARLHEITEGDPEFAHELASTFISSGYQVVQEIANALAAGDRVALTRAAHKLKGASANVYAQAVRELANTLEMQANAVDLPRLHELTEKLRQAFITAAAFLREQTPPPAAKAG